MSFPPATSAEDVIGQPAQAQFEAFPGEHRDGLDHCLDGLTEEQARRSLVPSRTTLLGLVKHATVVEKVWFDEAVTCRSRAEIGIPATPDESFILHDDDTIASVRQAHREACEPSRRMTASLGLDEIVRGNRRGPIPLRWVYLHVLRELAQHCGHVAIPLFTGLQTLKYRRLAGAGGTASGLMDLVFTAIAGHVTPSSSPLPRRTAGALSDLGP